MENSTRGHEWTQQMNKIFDEPKRNSIMTSNNVSLCLLHQENPANNLRLRMVNAL